MPNDLNLSVLSLSLSVWQSANYYLPITPTITHWHGSSSSFAHKTPLEHARWDTREQDAQGTYCAPTEALNN